MSAATPGHFFNHFVGNYGHILNPSITIICIYLQGQNLNLELLHWKYNKYSLFATERDKLLKDSMLQGDKQILHSSGKITFISALPFLSTLGSLTKI